jgi:GGDEF domain-containing protein
LLNQPQNGTSKPLDISAQDRGLTVEFSALDYSAPERNHYAYRLQGFDADWIATEPTRRFASYTNLPPGDYTMELRGSNREGDWSQTSLQIPIRVLPAWNQTLWFRGLASLLALALIGGLVQARTLYLQRRQRELQSLVDERTATLLQRTEELRASQQQLEQIAYIDPLTGLPNRRLFNDELRHQTALAARGGADFTLMLLDLDGFKQINDRYGHDAGDAMLEQTAKRLLRVMRESDRVWRTGGDEFAVLLPQTADRHAVDAAMMPDGATALGASIIASVAIK